MTTIDVGFCFYDEPEYVSDADRDSLTLRQWHAELWSKDLPSGDRLTWTLGSDDYLTWVASHGSMRVSSDTIATSHANYTRAGTGRLWAELTCREQQHYDRAFYTIGGFIIFPVHPGSLNQVRGRDPQIADRFDLTLECIRQHYLGRRANPLAAVLQVDAGFFGLFGEGAAGFAAYVEFFHLQDLVAAGRIRWLDATGSEEWDFATRPLPQSLDAYRWYLDNVAAFVAARNARIRAWCDITTSTER